MKKEEILAICIEEIRSGKSAVEDCVKRYPALEKELRALLEIAAALKPDEVSPSPEFKTRAKLHLFDDRQPAPMKISDRIRGWFALTPVKVTASVFIGILDFRRGGRRYGLCCPELHTGSNTLSGQDAGREYSINFNHESGSQRSPVSSVSAATHQ